MMKFPTYIIEIYNHNYTNNTLTALISIYIYAVLCVSVCLSARNSGTDRMIASKFSW